ncbi:hypothetical protein SAMN04489716_6894 [Actinoplanes derwentensis]|uniref:Helix-turn-helix domain-containing protein n=1 Tax=Actinoplanes derwentensis TaxID=113562 RepID=A0A1H2CUJ3_9ACTN|nr:hypothetical protein Ade03nite_08670 [Actinoplanes derwentensis]SDT74153.1 hypothetical protein SAMN04489716_6894 [Actinoplanes derwentensis]
MAFVSELQRAVANSSMASTGKLIMLTLAIKADWETGVIPPAYTPALSTLATMTGYSRSTVAEWLNVLETFGWVKREQIKGGRTNYTLLIGAPQVPPPERASRRPTKADSPPGGHPANSATVGNSPEFGSPPSGPVREADPSSSPPGGTEPVRLADPSSPPGGHASKEISPTERSTSRDIPHASPPPSRRPSSGAPRSRSRSPAVDGIPLPPDFHATEEMIGWSRTETPNVGHRETAAFVDYWSARSGPEALRRDLNAWVMTWRNWMRMEQKKVERSPGFRGTAVQTAVDPIPAPRLSADDACPRHIGHRAATCGLCRSERIGTRT